MRIETKTHILRVAWGIAAMIVLIFVVVSYQPERAKKWTEQEKFFGDMFALNGVRLFKLPIEKVDAQSSTMKKDAEVIMIGDSFLDANFDGPKLLNRFEERTQLPTFQPDKDEQKYLFHPERFFRGHALPQARILVWEQAERHIVSQYLTQHKQEERDIEYFIPQRISDTQSYQLYTKLRTKIFLVDPLLYLVQHLWFTQPIFEQLMTARFALTGDISPRTPEYSAPHRLIFYDAEIENARVELNDDDIKQIATSIQQQIHNIEQRYGIEVIFLPLPSKYTIYRDHLQDTTYNNALPRLVSVLQQRNVQVVDILPTFAKAYAADELLYYSNDTHWTPAAREITIDVLMQELSKLKF